MKKIIEVYQDYQIMPALQQHQLRVSAVAAEISRHWHGKTVDVQAIISACLLHDMGNIIKFDLQKFPEFLAPEGPDYWQSVQNEFVDRYGRDEHHASQEIAKKVTANPEVITLIESISFDKYLENKNGGEWAAKICAYADMRVAPTGITSLNERLADLEVRYQAKYPSAEQAARRQQFARSMHQIEQQLQAQTDIELHLITESSVDDTIETLKNWQFDPTSDRQLLAQLAN